jgi:hypothetical protein
MKESSKNKIKLLYFDADKDTDQSKIDDVYDFIFEETISQMEFDNHQTLSYPNEPLVKKANNN